MWPVNGVYIDIVFFCKLKAIQKFKYYGFYKFTPDKNSLGCDCEMKDDLSQQLFSVSGSHFQGWEWTG